jgi:hypothetical protein
LPTGEVVAEKECVKLDSGFGHDDIRLPTRYIVPFQIKELQITLTLAYDAAANDNIPEANAAAVRLLFHPANDTKYRLVPGYDGGTTTQTYSIIFERTEEKDDLIMTDPVYNVDSDWRFGFTLFTNDQPCLGTWAGSYTISVKAIRNLDIRIF